MATAGRPRTLHRHDADDDGSPAASHALTIRMTEYAFDPKDAVAKAGKVTITAPNDGQIVHELVLLKTDADPANLPKKGDEVDESTSVGEIADVEPGTRRRRRSSSRRASTRWSARCPATTRAGCMDR